MASGALERMSGLAEIIFRKYRFNPNDTLVIVSNSGVNAVPVEMAKLCSEPGPQDHWDHLHCLQPGHGETKRPLWDPRGPCGCGSG